MWQFLQRNNKSPFRVIISRSASIYERSILATQEGGIEMGMQDVALLGVFAAIAAFGYCVMGRADRFLDKVRPAGEERERAICLRIATSCVNAIPAVSDILKDVRHSYPHARCNLSVGGEQEVMQAFDRGDADVAIISADSKMQSETLAQWQCITLAPRPFSMDQGTIEVKAVERNPLHQKVLWKSGDSRSMVLRFIDCLCGQRP